MENAINITPSLAEGITALDAARTNLVKAAKGTKDVIQAYADAITTAFGANWFNLTGKDKKGIKAEREKFIAAMAERDLPKATATVYWQRVKEAAGYVTAGNRVKGAGGVDQKNLDDLKTIINRIFKAEENGEETAWSDEKAVLMDVYDRMGGEVDKLG